jgi:rfaE bifunctional protein nucleotidyltransferase chain/domain
MKVKKITDKIIKFTDIESLCLKIRQGKKTIVTTNGCFDILHLGHIRYLQDASEFGDIFIVGINSQESVRRLKGEGRPVTSEIGRILVMAALGFIDYCVLFNEDTPVELLRKIKPDVHVKGGDYSVNELIEREVVEKNGGKIVIIPLTKGFSTTSILEKMRGEINGL